MQVSDFSQRLGSALIDGLSAGCNGPRTHTLERVLAQLRASVGCDASWWGLVDRDIDGPKPPRFDSVGAYGLDQAVLESYLTLFSGDSFAAEVLASPDEARVWSGVNDDIPKPLQDWVRQSRLAHGLAICSSKPFDDQIFVVALYRFSADEPFSHADAALATFLFKQLILLWRQSLQETLRAASAESLSQMLLANVDGGVLFCGGKMAAQLSMIGWNPLSHSLPQALFRTLHAGGRVKVGTEWIVVNRDDEGLRAVLAVAGASPPLPTRLVQVAALACDGLSAKQIAANLGLSPATVRTYLRDAYAQLGVRNRVELHVAFRRAISSK